MMSKKRPNKKPFQKLESQDPDSWLRKLRTPDDVKKWLETEKDYITDYMVNICSAAAQGPTSNAEQTKKLGELIELIPDDTLRKAYFNEVRQSWGVFRQLYTLKKRDTEIPLPKLDKLNQEDKASFFDFGFWEENGAYYTMKGSKFRICNFTIQILYFVRSENQPKYVCIFTTMFGRSRISAVTTDDFTSVGQFRKVVGRLHGFVFEGTDEHLNKIKLKLFHGVPEAEEPKFMGFNQNGGFYTWANGLYYNRQFYKSDKYGIVRLEHPIASLEDLKALPAESHVKFDDQIHILENPEAFLETNGEDVVTQYIAQQKAMHVNYYFLPFSTRLKVTEHDDDDFEFERKFRHTPGKGEPVTFERWAKLMDDVYGANGCVGVVYFCMSLFRDIVFKHNNNYIPMLGFFGPRQSGKSTAARSLNKMFGEGLEDGVNLESGSTSTGVRRYLASMQNAILWLNEYKNSLPDATLGMIKGIADGSGKLTGRNTGGNETKTYKPRCAVVVCGQDIPTKDPAILSRMVVCEFDGKSRNYQSYQELTQLEKDMQCTSVTLEVLGYREQVKQYFKVMEPECTKAFRRAIKDVLKQDAEDRIVLNNSSLLAVYLILSECGLKFPFTHEELNSILLCKVETQISIQHTSDDVEQYFNVLQMLIDQHKVKEGEHFKITKDVSGIRKLFLRVRPINPEYMAAANRAGMAAMTLGTIQSYLTKHKSFIEYKKDGVYFDKFGENGGRTSAFVFNYDILLSQGIEFKSMKDMDMLLTSE